MYGILRLLYQMMILINICGCERVVEINEWYFKKDTRFF